MILLVILEEGKEYNEGFFFFLSCLNSPVVILNCSFNLILIVLGDFVALSLTVMKQTTV